MLHEQKSASAVSDISFRSTLVVGLGNPLLGDDGVGWRVAEQVQRQLENAARPVEVDCLAVGGLRLMERLVGCERAVLIDAITTGQQPPGSIYRFALEDLPDLSAGHLGSAHDTSLQTAFRVGRALDAPLPTEVMIIGVEVNINYEFSEDLTPAVAAAVPRAVQMVMELLGQS